MKRGTLTTVAALAVATIIGTAAGPADAGPRKKRQIVIHPNVSTQNLRAVRGRLRGRERAAVDYEIKRRRKIEADRRHQARVRQLPQARAHARMSRTYGRAIGNMRGADVLLGIGIAATELSTQNWGGSRGGHGH